MLFADRPTSRASGEPSIRRAFNAIYSVLEWCRVVRKGGGACAFLREIRSAAPMSIALASVGIYDAAFLNLRYSVECLLSYLYFRDHPRELELAENDEDMWVLTRPKTVVQFLRKLPEYESQVASSVLSQVYSLYQDLCKHAHPRSTKRMRFRKHLIDLNPTASEATEYAQVVLRLSRCACALLRFTDRTAFERASETTQYTMMRTVAADFRRKVELVLR